jgi:hypothetical protein
LVGQNTDKPQRFIREQKGDVFLQA